MIATGGPRCYDASPSTGHHGKSLNMPTLLDSIDKMSRAEKVQAMDYLWTSLEADAGGYEPPSWHGRELKRRDRLYAENKVPVFDWVEAKARLEARRAAL